MNKTVFLVKQMDCPAEEQMVRMKLDGISSVKTLSFDLEKRTLTVIHDNDLENIRALVDSLKLGSSVIEDASTSEETVSAGSADRNLLWAVLIINLSFFIIEALAGFISRSMGLVADSLDMLADAAVYGLSIYAVSRTVNAKKMIAGVSGLLQLLLALAGLAEVVRRFIGTEAAPDPAYMIVVSLFALVANTASLVLLNRSASREAHIRSSMIFTSNDVIANIGVILAGVLVLLLRSKVPDLVVGALVFLIVLRGAVRIFKLSR